MISDELKQDRAISLRMERAWHAFFSAFGRLTEVQRRSIPHILKGTDLLVCAATAAGKTEAAVAPLVERNLGRPDPWTILYISPTRALVNDLYNRLERPLHELGLRLGRKTGDYQQAGGSPHVLLTTPESFDSLLCRGRTFRPDGHALAQVTAVVLDEVHLFHGNPRGEQLRWLLERLRRLRSEACRKGWVGDDQVQVIGLSATVPDAEAVAAAYTPQGQIVKVPGGRQIEAVTAPCDSPVTEQAVPAYVAALERPEKILVFCNARRRVDELTVHLREALTPHGYQVRAHHGSLDRKVREDAEAAARSENRIVIVATSTLEIGVDIGDIDLVVLDSPAPDIPALLQRIGRGNRRSGFTRVMACAGCLSEVLVHAAMIEAAREGWLGPDQSGPQHAVARQQLASYIFQAPRRSRQRQSLQAFLERLAAPVAAASLLDHLVRQGDLLEDAAGIRLNQDWLDASARGEIHANLEGSLGADVTDSATGTTLATGVRFRGGKGLLVGGELLQVRRWDERRIEVERVKGASSDGQWGYSSTAWMKGPGQPQAVRRHLGFDEHEWPLVEHEGAVYLFHLGGARRRAVIDLIAGRPAPPGIRITEWFLRLPSLEASKPAWLLAKGPALLDVELVQRLDSLEHLLARPAANKKLPLDVRLDEVRGWLSLNDEVQAIHSAVCREVTDTVGAEALLTFVQTMGSGSD